MSVSTHIFQRTFCLRFNNSFGTCFAYDLEGKRYIITARHLVSKLQGKSEVEILFDGRWIRIGVDIVMHGEGDCDISVLAPLKFFGFSQFMGIHPDLNIDSSFNMSERVYFLGFPYGHYTNLGNFPAPLVKTGIISGSSPQQNLIYLDGHNNPGFSGGPVVLERKDSRVIGVISGYQHEEQFVLDKNGIKGPYTYYQNTGIVNVSMFNNVKESILSNPIGADVSIAYMKQ